MGGTVVDHSEQFPNSSRTSIREEGTNSGVTTTIYST